MIGPILRLVLTAAAWASVLLGVIRCVDLLHGQNQDFEHAVWGLISGFIQAGVLLALLSIDQRLEKREV